MSTTSPSIEELLQATSRTFALSIPLLPKPLCDEITLAYLVFRIADTIEDADHLGRDDRCNSLTQLLEILQALLITKSDDSSAVEAWSNQHREVSDNEDYNQLVSDTPRVLRLVAALRTPATVAIHRHASRSIRGMRATLRRADTDGGLVLNSVDELRQYCYYVAGIVGEMITELFLADHESSHGDVDGSQRSELHETAASFGEALQLVNILKDSGDDAICGRSYLPPQVPREQIHAIANKSLLSAERYVQTLRNIAAAPGMIAFCDAPLQLAKRTLQVVAQHGPGSKVPREETVRLLQDVIFRAGLQTG